MHPAEKHSPSQPLDACNCGRLFVLPHQRPSHRLPYRSTGLHKQLTQHDSIPTAPDRSTARVSPLGLQQRPSSTAAPSQHHPAARCRHRNIVRVAESPSKHRLAARPHCCNITGAARAAVAAVEPSSQHWFTARQRRPSIAGASPSRRRSTASPSQHRRSSSSRHHSIVGAASRRRSMASSEQLEPPSQHLSHRRSTGSRHAGAATASPEQLQAAVAARRHRSSPNIIGLPPQEALLFYALN